MCVHQHNCSLCGWVTCQQIKWQKTKNVCSCTCLCSIPPFLHIFWFSFPPQKFLLSSLPSVSSPATPVCCLSRGVGDRQTEKGREGEMETEREDGKQSRLQLVGSTLCPLDRIWMQRKHSLPDSLAERTEQCMEGWMGRWMYVARFVCWVSPVFSLYTIPYFLWENFYNIWQKMLVCI